MGCSTKFRIAQQDNPSLDNLFFDFYITRIGIYCVNIFDEKYGYENESRYSA